MMEVLEQSVKGCGQRKLQGEPLSVVPTNQDEILAHAYLRFKADGLLPDIFPEGETTLTWFLQLFAQRPVLVAYQGERLAGLGWMNTIVDMGTAGRKGECAMAFFPEIPFAEKLGLGRLMIDWAFENLNLTTLFGITPAPHKRALTFARLLWFDLYGPIPGLSAWRGRNSAAYTSVMSRAQWESRRAE
jgi:hypothetical protein